ncbi:hypothetical protein PI125_g20680 [Phytophthora idaei]|nr:hypothetical protein PI125_g20680 [Phytophthora idaei]
MLCGKSCARTKRFWWLCAPHYLVFTLCKLQLTETSNTCQSGKQRTTECQCDAGPTKAAVVSESAQERAVFQARSVPAVMAEVNKKLSEAVAAGEGAKHNIEVEETKEQSDDDSDDTMTAGFRKPHIFKKRRESPEAGEHGPRPEREGSSEGKHGSRSAREGCGEGSQPARL